MSSVIQRPREPGYVPAPSYETVTEYEPYPGAPTDLPYEVPYAPEYPHQAMHHVVREQGPTLPDSVRELLRNTGVFQGRTTRSSFWLGALGIVGTLAVATIIAVTLVLIVGISIGGSAAGVMVALTGGLLVLGGLGSLFTLASAGVRRLHDSGLPGWLLALWFVPFGWIAVVVLLARPGQARRNGFGPDPDAL